MLRVPLRLPLLASLAIHAALAVVAVRGTRPAPPPDPAAATSSTLAGETFEVPDQEEESAGASGSAGQAAPTDEGASEAPSEAPSDSLGNAEPNAIELGGPPPPRKPHRASHSRGGAPAAAAVAGSGAEAHGPPLVYGAAGERGTVDLATAFTRGIPQAASGDPRWLSASFGPAGEAVLTLEIDATGALVGHSIAGSPSVALQRAIDNTIRLIGARQFTARGAKTRLRISATVSPDQVHDGLHGDVFAIGGSFAQSEGSAFFALAIGRRIDVRVRALP